MYMPSKVTGKKIKSTPGVSPLESIYAMWGYTLLLWAPYRYFFRGTPEALDEFVMKPLIFLGPMLWYVFKKEKRSWESLGVTGKKFFPSLYIGIAFGVVFALEGIISNVVKYGKLNIRPIAAVDQNGLILLFILSLATAIVEELLSRGFLFNRIYEQTKNLPKAVVVSTLCFVALHVPILVSSLHFQGVTLVLFFLTTCVLGVANALLFVNTGSLVAPILVHLFWNMTVALYL